MTQTPRDAAIVFAKQLVENESKLIQPEPGLHNLAYVFLAEVTARENAEAELNSVNTDDRNSMHALEKEFAAMLERAEKTEAEVTQLNWEVKASWEPRLKSAEKELADAREKITELTRAATYADIEIRTVRLIERERDALQSQVEQLESERSVVLAGEDLAKIEQLEYEKKAAWQMLALEQEKVSKLESTIAGMRVFIKAEYDAMGGDTECECSHTDSNICFFCRSRKALEKR